jgi:hypothetical protein
LLVTVTPLEREWREWRLREGRYKDYLGSRPKHFPATIPREWWTRLEAFVARRRATVASPLLMGFVLDISHIQTDSPRADAFVAAGGTKILLQFGQPPFAGRDSDAINRAGVAGWAAAWAARGVTVEGWWRVEQYAPDRHPDVPGISAWWPNPEQPPEFARMPAIDVAGGCVGLVTLGKTPLAVPMSDDRPVAIECFREKPESDTNVRNSVTYWRDERGLPVDRIIVMLQGYGIPFQPAPLEAAAGIALGVRKFAFYPIDGFTTTDILAVGKLL